jgi:hypothetical protein
MFEEGQAVRCVTASGWINQARRRSDGPAFNQILAVQAVREEINFLTGGPETFLVFAAWPEAAYRATSFRPLGEEQIAAMRERAQNLKPARARWPYLARVAALGLLALHLLALAAPARAHDFWANGEPVPPWVKASCCGPQDVHHLRPGAVHVMADGYHIDGLDTIVPIARALPSPDGSYWGFWNAGAEPKPVIFCFFAPVNGV